MSYHAHNNIHADDNASHEKSPAFAGRLGANRAYVVRRDDTKQSERLSGEPDAIDGMTLAEQMDLRPFATLALWKATFLEGCFEWNRALVRSLDSQLMRVRRHDDARLLDSVGRHISRHNANSA